MLGIDRQKKKKRMRGMERERERKHLSTGNGHTVISSPLLPLSRILARHTHSHAWCVFQPAGSRT